MNNDLSPDRGVDKLMISKFLNVLIKDNRLRKIIAFDFNGELKEEVQSSNFYFSNDSFYEQ
jgi:hypothetical protein